jgi:type I site-specific restriction endonuclease
VVEAKDNTHTVGFGMQQAMTYAQMLDVPFAYSSNGDGFLEHDFLAGMERQISMDVFPSQEFNLMNIVFMVTSQYFLPYSSEHLPRGDEMGK